MYRDFQNFFHQVICKKILYVHITDSRLTCNMLLHYHAKVKNPKNVTKFSR